MKSVALLLSMLLFLSFISCKKPSNPDPNLDQIEASIKSSKLTISFNPSGEEIDFKITSNVKYSIDYPQWVSESSRAIIDENNTTITVSATSNDGESKREDVILIKELGGEESVEIDVSQDVFTYENQVGDDIKDDILVKVTSATASSFQPGSGIEFTIDGNTSGEIWHSNWNNTIPNYFPIYATYNFDSADIDYIVYYPRISGSNGHFEQVEIYGKLVDGSEELLKSVDFGGSGSPTKVMFDQTLKGVEYIKFKILSGFGDGVGFAACTEMEFRQFNPDNFDPITLFTDKTCSELKEGITLAEIEACDNDFFKNIAMFMYKGTYPREFRIAEYKAWLNPNIQAEELKTNPYSLLDNPTGMSVSAGDELVVLVGETNGVNISIKVQNLNRPNGDGYGTGSSSYPLSEGTNIIRPANEGLIYLMYHSATPELLEPIKVHFATGDVNGYFDITKHSAEEWEKRLNATTNRYFDILGIYSHATFPVSSFKQYTPDGVALIQAFDDLVYKEADFMGLVKYDKMFKNRHYFHVMYTSFMYATAYRTAYNVTTMENLCSVEKLTSEPWGPAHEVGHCNQTRPNLKWIGMTEVTNNIHSLYIQTQWGNESRLVQEGRYASAHNDVSGGNIAHINMSNEFNMLVPFWQLHLYLSNNGYPDFYKDLFEKARLRSSSLSNGECQLDFVKMVMEITELDLTDFFTYWGFLTPVDRMVEDYSTERLLITQKDIDELLNWVKEQNYSKPDHDFSKIADDNLSDYL